MRNPGIKTRLVAALLGAFLALPARPVHAADDERDRQLQPERVMDILGLRPGMVIGEAGAGRGYFTLKLARRVAPSGKVYANDIDRQALGELQAACTAAALHNVETIVGETDDPLFPRGGLEVVIMVYALHDFAHPALFLTNLKKYLGPAGRVVILDQNPEATGDRHFMTRERLLTVFADGGYELVQEESFLERHLLLVFRPA